MGKFTARHVFDVDVDTYWNEVFFDEVYNQRLFTEALGFKYELLSLVKNPDGSYDRRVRTEPESNAPAVIKKLVGDKFSYLEVGHFDPATRIWTYEVTPSSLTGKLEIRGVFWAESKGDNQLTRIVETTVGVKVFGVGKVIEAFIEKETRGSFAKAQKFTNQWLADRG
jgi:hypothetical protein